MDQIRSQLPLSVRWSQTIPGNSCDVLIVDDDEAIRESMSEVLNDEGLSVRTAANGQEGLERARALRPKVIVLDMMMPVVNGWEFLGVLEQDPELKRIPVVQMSAFLTSSTPPAVHRLRKPFEQEDLLRAVGPHVRLSLV
jgi:CheY-like chemotaxis protein